VDRISRRQGYGRRSDHEVPPHLLRPRRGAHVGDQAPCFAQRAFGPAR